MAASAPCSLYFILLVFFVYHPLIVHLPVPKLAGGLLTGRYQYKDLEKQPDGRFFCDPKWSPA